MEAYALLKPSICLPEQVKRYKFLIKDMGVNMHTMTINIADEQTTEKVRWMLDHFRNDGVEIVSEEDLNDLKAL